MKLQSIPLKATFGCLTILILFGDLATQAQSASGADIRIRESFYDLLDVILDDSSADQIFTLQGFIENHPGFERAYLKLLERYLVHNKMVEAKAYFRKLAANSIYRRNSYWMLAKLFILQNDTSASFKAYHQAFRAGPPSTALLKDFVEYHHQSKKTEWRSSLRQLRLSAESAKLASAFLHFFNLNDGQAIRLFCEIPDAASHEAVVLDVLGYCYYRLSRYGEADSLWRLGLANSRLRNDLELEAQFLCNLGLLSAKANGQYNQALSYCDSAYAIAECLDDLYLKQLVMGYSAYVFTVRRNYAEAIKQYQQAIGLASQVSLYSYIAAWYYGCAKALTRLRRYHEALLSYDRCEAYSYRTNNEEHLFLLRLGKGDLYFYLKQYALARQVFQEAYELARRKEWLKEQYDARAGLADLMVVEGLYENAREAYREFINFLRREGSLLECAYWTGRLADAYEKEGHGELAKAAYMQAYKMAKQARSKPYMPWYLIKAANIEASAGDIAAAIQKCNVASEIDTSKSNKEIWVELYLALGNAYKNEGDLSQAILFYSRAAHLIEDARQNIAIEQLRVGYFSAWCEVYRRLVQCFLERYEKTGSRADLDSLYYYEEMSRSRTLQDLQFRAGANTPGRSDSHLDQEYLKACTQLRLMQRRLRQEAEKIRPAEEWNHLLAQLEAARFSLVAQRLRLVKDDSTSSHIRNEPMRHLSAVLQNLKRADLGLLQYHISNEAAFVLAAAGDSVRVVSLKMKPSSLAAAIDSLMAPFHVVGDGSPGQLPFRAAIAHRLYRSLVEPAEIVLKLPPRLLVVPDLALTNLPFEMLLVTSPEKADYTPSDFPDYAEGFLLHRYRIVYIPSTSILQERPAAVSPDAKLLVLANPFANTIGHKVNQSRLRAATGWSFDPLPFSEAEAKSIAEIYPSARLYKRDSATKTRFVQEASQQQMMHIASHAFVDTTFDAFSGLFLAIGPDSTDDGILMGYEIPDLNLNCDLITLSACETGRGKLVAGEGVLGLPRLFLRAGAKTVLMTQWKVDDKFASKLMPEFYAGLLKKKLSKTDALSEAKRAVLRQNCAENGFYYQHPFYWASFVLYGDPGLNNGRSSIPAAKWIVAFFVVLLLLVALPRYVRQRHRS